MGLRQIPSFILWGVVVSYVGLLGRCLGSDIILPVCVGGGFLPKVVL